MKTSKYNNHSTERQRVRWERGEVNYKTCLRMKSGYFLPVVSSSLILLFDFLLSTLASEHLDNF